MLCVVRSSQRRSPTAPGTRGWPRPARLGVSGGRSGGARDAGKREGAAGTGRPPRPRPSPTLSGGIWEVQLAMDSGEREGMSLSLCATGWMRESAFPASCRHGLCWFGDLSDCAGEVHVSAAGGLWGPGQSLGADSGLQAEGGLQGREARMMSSQESRFRQLAEGSAGSSFTVWVES